MNQALFFAAILLVFLLGRVLFDNSVAWVCAGIFAATELYWRLSASGLSTMLLVVIFLAIVLSLVHVERQEKGGLPLALGTGVLLALGGLTVYSFAWLVVPVVFFLYFGVPQRRKLCFAVVLPFLILTVPWLARNYALTGNLYGTSGYAIYQNTSAFPADTLERSLNLQNGLTRLYPRDITDKFTSNIHTLLQNEVPKLGGNWVSAFFLVGLLIPFRKEALSKIRFFLLGSLVLFLCVQSIGQTHLTTDSPEINSENLLVVLAPLAFLFGTGLFFTLIDQLADLTPQSVRICTGLFFMAVCAPLYFVFSFAPGLSGIQSLGQCQHQMGFTVVQRQGINDERRALSNGLVWTTPLRLANSQCRGTILKIARFGTHPLPLSDPEDHRSPSVPISSEKELLGRFCAGFLGKQASP